jgi:hypothetical protein
LKTKNLKLAREELHRRRCGLKPVEAASTVTCGDVIRRYKDDDYPDDQRQARPARAHELEARFCTNLLPFWDKVPVDAVTNATCDRYCDYRVKLIRAAQPDRMADSPRR